MSKSLEHSLINKYKYTRSKALFLIKNGFVSVNGITIFKRSFMVQHIDEIFVKIPTLNSKIVWRNENLLVAYKPSGMVVERCSTTSLAHSVLCEDICQQLKIDQVFPIHRIDKDTSGLILIALNEKSFTYYKELMNARKFTKAYKAFYVNSQYQLNNPSIFECHHGKLIFSYEPECLCEKIAQYKLHTIRINETSQEIKLSATGTKICETLMSPIENGYNCILITGRTHQIRLTMKSIKQVIAGDELYGSREICQLQLFAYYIDIDKNIII